MRDESLDEMRRQVQQSLLKAKREQLQDKFGMSLSGFRDDLPAEAELEWLEYIHQFERQLALGRQTTVRRRLGNPELKPVAALEEGGAAAALDALLDRLGEHNIAVDFMGEWAERDAYRYLVEELMDTEIDDIEIEGLVLNFIPATPAYEAEMSVDFFVHAVFDRNLDILLAALTHQEVRDSDGTLMDSSLYTARLREVWRCLPPVRFDALRATTVEIEADDAVVATTVSWFDGKQKAEATSAFWLRPCPYADWDVVRSTFLDDLLAKYAV